MMIYFFKKRVCNGEEVEIWEKRKFSLYQGEKNIFLEKGGGAKLSYFEQIYTPGKI